MTVVAWRDIRVRVRIAARTEEELERAFADVQRAVGLAASRKVLTARYHLVGHDTYSTTVEPISQAQLDETIDGQTQ